MQETKKILTTKTDDYQYESEEEREQQTSKKPDKNLMNGLIKKKQKKTGINRELFRKHFNFQRPSDMLKVFYTANAKKKNGDLVVAVVATKSGLSDLRKEIENVSEKEKKIEKPNEVVDIFKEILRLNKRKQEGQGLKVLTPDQMLNSLPTTLAQLKVGNNSEKLKNEIRQLLYSLYCSKKFTKTIYNHFINTI